MTEKPLNRKNTAILLSTIVFTLIGAYCLLCSFFTSDFASLHIYLLNTDLPIFIGEITLAICLLLTLLRIRLEGKEHKTDQWMALYFCFVVLLAAMDSLENGYLAFRNAAMLYYVLFAWITYRCYMGSVFFPTKFLYGLIIAIAFILMNGNLGDYYWFTYLVLFNIIIIKTKQKWLICLGVLLSLYQIGQLFSVSRSHFVAAIASFVFIVLVSRRQFFPMPKKVVISITIIFLVIGSILFADHNAVKSLLNVQTLIERYKREQALIDYRSQRFTPAPLKVEIYRTERILTRKNIFGSQGVAKTSDKEFSDRKLPVCETQNFAKNKQVENVSKPVESKLPFNDKKQLVSDNNPVVDSGSGGQKSLRDLDVAYNNILFRYFIWRDMVQEWLETNFLFGVGLGKPQRSPSLEKLRWGFTEWTNVGWVTPHNYFLHLLYRLGLIGLIFICILIYSLVKLTKIFILHKDFVGLLLVGVLIYWLVVAQFLVIMELPYCAILFWSLFGATFAYARGFREKKKHAPIAKS